MHKHDDNSDNPSGNIPFLVQSTNDGTILKFRSDSHHLDCEVKQTYRFFIRAYDCAATGKRRYSERYVRRKKQHQIFLFRATAAAVIVVFFFD